MSLVLVPDNYGPVVKSIAIECSKLSLYDTFQVRAVLSAWPGLGANHNKPWQHLADAFYMALTMKQFKVYQGYHLQFQFMSYSQIRSITGNKRLIKLWSDAVAMANAWYWECTHDMGYFKQLQEEQLG